jgi:hypothetical protein
MRTLGVIIRRAFIVGPSDNLVIQGITQIEPMIDRTWSSGLASCVAALAAHDHEIAVNDLGLKMA